MPMFAASAANVAGLAHAHAHAHAHAYALCCERRSCECPDDLSCAMRCGAREHRRPAADGGRLQPEPRQRDA